LPINLTPLIPLSFSRREGKVLERGFAPLLPALPLPLSREGGQGDRLPNNLESFKLANLFSIMLVRVEGCSRRN